MPETVPRRFAVVTGASSGIGRELYARIREAGREVDAIALNAGRGAGGPFVPGSHPSGARTALSDEFAVIDLNVRSTTHLAKFVLADKVKAAMHGNLAEPGSGD